MDKNELMQLAANRDLIPGIYNYCDRWCERCPFTARCLVFATEKADETFDDAEVHDINNAKFWQKLESTFQEVRQMIVDWAEEEGIDLETEGDTAVAKREQQRHDAKENQLSVSARHYAATVQQWFVSELAVAQTVHDDTNGKSNSGDEDIDVGDAIEVIRWYQFFIPAKIFRALMSFERQTPNEDVEDDDPFVAVETADDEALLTEVMVNQSDGSAKIALIAIDRSLNAWRILRFSFPEKTESIMPMLGELDRLRIATEKTFPHARDVIRPGFDEVISEFAS